MPLDPMHAQQPWAKTSQIASPQPWGIRQALYDANGKVVLDATGQAVTILVVPPPPTPAGTPVVNPPPPTGTTVGTGLPPIPVVFP